MASPDIWIVDSSPIIALSKAGQRDLLIGPGREIWIVEAVQREIEAGPSGDPARLALSQGWGTRSPSPSIPLALQEWALDAGEEATLALALAEPDALVVLDDGDGRRAAKALGIPFIGTVGVVLRARQEGRIAAAAPIFRGYSRQVCFSPQMLCWLLCWQCSARHGRDEISDTPTAKARGVLASTSVLALLLTQGVEEHSPQAFRRASPHLFRRAPPYSSFLTLPVQAEVCSLPHSRLCPKCTHTDKHEYVPTRPS